MNWGKIALIIVIIGCFWWLLNFFRSNPNAFSVRKLNKSFFTMGALALLLIAFIALCVVWMRV